MKKILVIQTAFIGDVVLATGIIEKLHLFYPQASIDLLVRKGNETLFDKHPFLHHVLVWDKREGKYKQLLRIIREVRRNRYDLVVNVQRFAATGMITVLSGAALTVGFDKNPFSFLFSRRIKHRISHDGDTVHEIERNNDLIASLTDGSPALPRLYPTADDYIRVERYRVGRYITIAPASVWFTKQYPADKWIEFIDALPSEIQVYLLGAPGDHALCEEVKKRTVHPKIENMAGKLNFLQSAALQEGAEMNYVNDSAPMHFASAVNAPVTAVYCSTVPAFGFGPLSAKRHIVETPVPLECRPCGLHGYKACPLGHFKCAYLITKEQLLKSLS